MKVYKRKEFLELENVLYMEIEEDINKYQIHINFNQIFLKLKTVNKNDFLLATIFNEMEDYDNYDLSKGYERKYIIDDTPSRDGCYHDSNENDLFLVFDNDDIEEIVNKLNKIRFNGFSEWLNGEEEHRQRMMNTINKNSKLIKSSKDLRFKDNITEEQAADLHFNIYKDKEED